MWAFRCIINVWCDCLGGGCENEYLWNKKLRHLHKKKQTKVVERGIETHISPKKFNSSFSHQHNFTHFDQLFKTKSFNIKVIFVIIQIGIPRRKGTNGISGETCGPTVRRVVTWQTTVIVGIIREQIVNINWGRGRGGGSKISCWWWIDTLLSWLQISQQLKKPVAWALPPGGGEDAGSASCLGSNRDGSIAETIKVDKKCTASL